jgi:hypothetical protein
MRPAEGKRLMILVAMFHERCLGKLPIVCVIVAYRDAVRLGKDFKGSLGLQRLVGLGTLL